MANKNRYPSDYDERMFIRLQDAVDSLDADEVAALRAILDPNKQIIGADYRSSNSPVAADKTESALDTLPVGAVMIQCDANGRPRGEKVTKSAESHYVFASEAGRYRTASSAGQHGPYLLISVPENPHNPSH